MQSNFTKYNKKVKKYLSQTSSAKMSKTLFLIEIK